MEKFELSRPTDRLPLPGMCVLIADDSVALRQFLLIALQVTGFEIVSANDGRDAYEKAVAHSFDLIITDHNMPHVDGVELITRLRALPQYKSVPILVLTVETNEELKQKAKASGATGWIVKPVHPDTIVTLVRKLLIPQIH